MAIFGLMNCPRLYRCDVCNDEHMISTNHTDGCWPPCPNCSWRSGYDSQGNHYRADIGKNRPQIFIGDAPKADEYNPIHWGEDKKYGPVPDDERQAFAEAVKDVPLDKNGELLCFKKVQK